MKTIIKNATIINESQTFKGSLIINGDKIEKVIRADNELPTENHIKIIDAEGLYLLPGVIDDQVHFREPGLTHKGDIYSESKAAVAGGITSYMEMPNTIPQTTTLELLEQKYDLAASKSLANYSFYMGATNDNIAEIIKVNKENVCGVKVFMGSSTGNMLVNDTETLKNIFAESPVLVATHCEDETIIQKNIRYFQHIFNDCIKVDFHPLIRSAEACYQSSSFAVELAHRYNTRLHILHLSTEKELSLLDNTKPITEKNITAEACVHHLWFTDEDYKIYGNRIKWNPAIKKPSDRDALIDAINKNLIDVVATDHAPHSIEEKTADCYKASSGGPLVQHSLIAMLQLAKQRKFTIEKVVEKMCHTPADLFRIDKRGYIREGYYADLVLVNPNRPWIVEKGNILYKCGWSPFEGITFDSIIEKTFVNGKLVFDNGAFDECFRGSRLTFIA
ncbi:MAG: dihydroorotase [Paludibacteraceae bacterium]